MTEEQNQQEPPAPQADADESPEDRGTNALDNLGDLIAEFANSAIVLTFSRESAAAFRRVHRPFVTGLYRASRRLRRPVPLDRVAEWSVWGQESKRAGMSLPA